MNSAREFDVAVVGASVAGCTAARLFAQSGARVALIERRHDPAAFNGITCLVTSYHRSRLAEVRTDLEGSYMRQLASLPDGPDLSDAERVSKLIGKLEMPNVIRPAARPGLAFVGDAALATDPLFGVGISFAFQSGEWLVDETSGALGGGPELDDALRRYRRKFAWRLGPHHLQIADYATGRKLRPLERLTLRKATVDPVVARAFGEVLTRERSPLRLFDPRITARLLIPRRTPMRPSSKAWQSSPVHTTKQPA